MMGQLPKERVTPDAVFNNVGLDNAGPVYLKRGSIRRPVIVKAYICIFAVHIEAVSDLTSEAFLAYLRRFICHGTNFVGAKRILKELYEFMQRKNTNDVISNYCSAQGDFIPEHAPPSMPHILEDLRWRASKPIFTELSETRS